MNNETMSREGNSRLCDSYTCANHRHAEPFGELDDFSDAQLKETGLCRSSLKYSSHRAVLEGKAPELGGDVSHTGLGELAEGSQSLHSPTRCPRWGSWHCLAGCNSGWDRRGTPSSYCIWRWLGCWSSWYW